MKYGKEGNTRVEKIAVNSKSLLKLLSFCSHFKSLREDDQTFIGYVCVRRAFSSTHTNTKNRAKIIMSFYDSFCPKLKQTSATLRFYLNIFCFINFLDLQMEKRHFRYISDKIITSFHLVVCIKISYITYVFISLIVASDVEKLY